MNHNHSDASGMKHLVLMLACCLVPMAAILAIGVFRISLGSLGGLLPYAMVFLCPLMMFFMMRGMMGGQSSDPGGRELADPKRTPALRTTAATEPGGAEKSPPRCH